MSKVVKILGNLIRRPVQNINLENRAERELDRHLANPKAAPKHDSTKTAIAKDMQDSKDEYEAQQLKDDNLLDRMQGMIAEPEKVPEIQSRALPTSRQPGEEPAYGYQEPEKIPLGKCSLKQALEFITEHDQKPKEHTHVTIAEQYAMEAQKVDDILKHFRMMKLHIPEHLLENQSGEKQAVLEGIDHIRIKASNDDGPAKDKS